MVSPKVTHRLAGFQRTDRAFPVVYIIDPIAMSHASSGKTHETGMQIGQCLCQIGTKSVLTAFKSLLRKEGDHIQRVLSGNLRTDGQNGINGIGGYSEHSTLLLPLFGRDGNNRLCKLPARSVYQADLYLSPFAFHCFREK